MVVRSGDTGRGGAVTVAKAIRDQLRWLANWFGLKFEDEWLVDRLVIDVLVDYL